MSNATPQLADERADSDARLVRGRAHRPLASQIEDPYSDVPRAARAPAHQPDTGGRLAASRATHDVLSPAARRAVGDAQVTTGCCPGQDEENPGGRAVHAAAGCAQPHASAQAGLQGLHTARHRGVATTHRGASRNALARSRREAGRDGPGCGPGATGPGNAHLRDARRVPAEDQDRFVQWTADATHGLVVVRGLGDDELRQRVDEAGTSLLDVLQRLDRRAPRSASPTTCSRRSSRPRRRATGSRSSSCSLSRSAC